MFGFSIPEIILSVLTAIFTHSRSLLFKISPTDIARIGVNALIVFVALLQYASTGLALLATGVTALVNALQYLLSGPPKTPSN